MPAATTNVLGVHVHALDLDRATRLIVAAAQQPHSGYVCVADVRSIIATQDDPALREIFNQAFLVTPDGMPLVWLSPPGTSRVYGPDLLLAVCAAGRTVGLRHFFYGGGPGTAEALRDHLTERFPGLEVCGTYTPPFRDLTPEEENELEATVSAAQPHLLWVGISTPKQERFMATHAARLSNGLMIGVGAAFDFHSGRVKQAPRWMQRSGLEWLHRIAQEPARLGPRYLRTHPRFLWLLLKSRLFTRSTNTS